MPTSLRIRFATAELKLFSTAMRNRAVDLFLISRPAFGGARVTRPRESTGVAESVFRQS
jgi:hypothetical protein